MLSFIFPAGIGSCLKGLLNLLQINNAASAATRSPFSGCGEVVCAELAPLKSTPLLVAAAAPARGARDELTQGEGAHMGGLCPLYHENQTCESHTVTGESSGSERGTLGRSAGHGAHPGLMLSLLVHWLIKRHKPT